MMLPLVPKRFILRSLLSFFIFLMIFFYACSPSIQKPSPSADQGSAHAKSSKPYRVLGKWYQPMSNAKGFRQRGVASWYGEKFHGKKTSSGERYNMNAVSAAHKTLPLGTYVRVRNLQNSKTLDVIINDRGPFVAGRVIDLSKAAAKEIGVYSPGTAPVEVVALGIATSAASGRSSQPVSYVPVDYYRGNFTIQVGAFSELDNAKRLWKKLDRAYKNAHIEPYYPHQGGGRLHRVLVGKCYTLKQAGLYEDTMRKRGFKGAFIVAE